MSSKCKFSFFVLTRDVVCRGNLRINDFLTDALSVCVLTLFSVFAPCACLPFALYGRNAYKLKGNRRLERTS